MARGGQRGGAGARCAVPRSWGWGRWPEFWGVRVRDEWWRASCPSQRAGRQQGEENGQLRRERYVQGYGRWCPVSGHALPREDGLDSPFGGGA